MEKVTKQNKNGKVVYCDTEGEISTYEDELDFMISCVLEPLKDFLGMVFDDDEAQKMANIAEILLQRVEEKINTTIGYVIKNHGMIKLVRASYAQNRIKPETIFDIIFEPCEVNKAQGPEVTQ